MSNPNKVPDFLQLANDLKKNASRYAAVESVKFFKDSFVKGGFTDNSFVPWSQSSNPMSGKRVLYNKGILMQSIRTVESNTARIVVESNTAYSEIHNNGGEIVVTARMKKFFWAKYYEFSGKIRTTKIRGKVANDKNNRSINAKAEFCKRIALMKVGSKIKIPKHQFMGNSQSMMSQFQKWFDFTIGYQFEAIVNDKSDGKQEFIIKELK